MEYLRRRLPPPARLMTFEAVARHLSFTRAARELCVSQAATSRQIRLLEDQLGCLLFTREYRGIRLTGAGEQLYRAVHLGFSHMAEAFEALTRGEGRGGFTLAASLAFTTFWLMPRMSELDADHPLQDHRLLTSDADPDWGDPDLQAAIVFGAEPREGFRVEPLFRDRIFAVCRPGYFANRDGPPALVDLLQERLLHLDSERESWESWQSWFRGLGVNPPEDRPGPHFNNYPILLQAAQAGKGIALGWWRLISPLVEAGLLEPVLQQAFHPVQPYCLVTREGTSPSPAAAAFREWILGEAEDLKMADTWPDKASMRETN
jgi:DNA-binding transcriptional LysR family regulator